MADANGADKEEKTKDDKEEKEKEENSNGLNSENKGVVVAPKPISDYKFREDEEFSSDGGRLLFEGGASWKDWETASVAELKASLGDDNIWSDADLLRMLHLVVAFRNEGFSGHDYIPEDVVATKDMLVKSRAWKNENRESWSPELRERFRKMVWYQGRDKRGRPIGIIRPSREALDAEDWKAEDLNKAIYALIDNDIMGNYIPGVAEQACFIVDLIECGVADATAMVSSLQVLVEELTGNWPSRAAIFFIFNAPWLMNAAVQTVLCFTQQETQKKFQCYNATLSDYPEVMAEHFDLEYFPVEYGGKAAMICDVESPS